MLHQIATNRAFLPKNLAISSPTRDTGSSLGACPGATRCLEDGLRSLSVFANCRTPLADGDHAPLCDSYFCRFVLRDGGCIDDGGSRISERVEEDAILILDNNEVFITQALAMWSYFKSYGVCRSLMGAFLGKYW